jgi:hypothetical protein
MAQVEAYRGHGVRARRAACRHNAVKPHFSDASKRRDAHERCGRMREGAGGALQTVCSELRSGGGGAALSAYRGGARV